MTTPDSLVPLENIANRIHVIRGMKVMLDADLAELYEVETKALTRAVRRNVDRFPEDFMFELSAEEFDNLRRQFGTSSQWGGRRYPPYAFTEQGVAMLSGILNSMRAIQVNIQIMRTFVQLREMMAGNDQLRRKIEAMERKYDGQFKIVFDALKKILAAPAPKKRRIGFEPRK